MILETTDLKAETAAVIKWLDINKKLSEHSNAAFTYIRIIKEGLKSKSVASFIKHSSLTKKQVSKMIHVSERTLQRNPEDKLMDPSSSEKLVDLARLFYKGINVFEDKEKFITWLNRPNKALDNQLPIELIETNLGVDLVIDELLKIEHGVFS